MQALLAGELVVGLGYVLLHWSTALADLGLHSQLAQRAP